MPSSILFHAKLFHAKSYIICIICYNSESQEKKQAGYNEGKIIENVLPFPGELCAETVPRWA